MDAESLNALPVGAMRVGRCLTEEKKSMDYLPKFPISIQQSDDDVLWTKKAGPDGWLMAKPRM